MTTTKKKVNPLSVFEEVSDVEIRNRERILDLFTKSGVVGIVGDTNSSKSNTAFWVITSLLEKYDINLYTFRMQKQIRGAIRLSNLNEMEKITNSIIFLDEANFLLQTNNQLRKEKVQKFFQLVKHNNNLIVLISVPQGFDKFLSSKLDSIIFHETTIAQCINRSYVADTVKLYEEAERGATILSLPPGKCILFDGSHFYKAAIPYIKEADTKAKNPPLLKPKSKG